MHRTGRIITTHNSTTTSSTEGFEELEHLLAMDLLQIQAAFLLILALGVVAALSLLLMYLVAVLVYFVPGLFPLNRSRLDLFPHHPYQVAPEDH